MESEDKEILAKILARPIGEAVSQWAKKNDVESPVEVYAELSTPTLYLDENGVAHKRHVTDPHDITGNDLEVTGISFKPDKEFLELATKRPANFRHIAPRGVVGRSPVFTRQEMINLLFDYLDKENTISRRIFIMITQLTMYQAKKWLKELSTGDNPPLLEIWAANAYIYQRNPNYVPET
jgi:hypothetical protein